MSVYYACTDDNTVNVATSTIQVLWISWNVNVTVYCCVASSKVHPISVTSSCPSPALARAASIASCWFSSNDVFDLSSFSVFLVSSFFSSTGSKVETSSFSLLSYTHKIHHSY